MSVNIHRENYIISFRKAKKLYKKFLENDIKRYDLSQNEFEIIMHLRRHPEQNTAKEIVEHLGVSKGMISRTIDILIQKGIVELERDKIDKRLIRLKLTKSSDSFISSLENASDKFFKTLLQGVDEEKVKIFTQVLGDMINNLETLEKNI